MLIFSFIFLFSATKLSKECHPDPQPYREATPSSHPTPNHIVLTLAPCSLGLVVSVFVELCNAGGGSSVECYFSGGGDGLKVSIIRFTLKHGQTDKACLDHWFLLGSICTHCSLWLLQHGPSTDLPSTYINWHDIITIRNSLCHLLLN